MNIQSYTKHYYIESDRFVSKIGGGMANINYRLHDHVYGMDINDPSDYENKSRDLFEDGMMLRHFDIIDVHAEVIKDYDFRQISKLQEYDEEEKEFFFYHKDHLGSSTQISDRDAKIIHHIEYMPSGEQFSEQHCSMPLPYKFNSKELDAETGLYYYGARYYTPEIGIWLSVDPLSDKYPHQSNYMYCSGRLVNVIDPDGRDEWEVNVSGNVVKRIPNDKKDAFHMVDDKGKRVDGKSVEFEKGTVDNSFSYSDKKKNPKTEKMENVSIDGYVINGDTQSEDLFKFFSNNTDVEWGNTKVENEKSILTTSHKKDIEYGSSDVAKFLNSLGVNISGHDHNHPGDDPKPSPSDMKFSHWVNSRNPNFVSRIYTSKSGAFHNYDKDGYIGPITIPATNIVGSKK